MSQAKSATIKECLSSVTEPRVGRNKLRNLSDILIMPICAVTGGEDGWEAIGNYGKAKKECPETFPELPDGIPSHDT